jgi:hypothetical protein
MGWLAPACQGAWHPRAYAYGRLAKLASRAGGGQVKYK